MGSLLGLPILGVSLGGLYHERSKFGSQSPFRGSRFIFSAPIKVFSGDPRTTMAQARALPLSGEPHQVFFSFSHQPSASPHTQMDLCYALYILLGTYILCSTHVSRYPRSLAAELMFQYTQGIGTLKKCLPSLGIMD